MIIINGLKKKKYIESKAYVSDTNYWTEKLKEFKSHSFPYKKETEDYEEARYVITASTEMSDKIREFCRIQKVSVPCFFLCDLCTL